MFDYNFILDRKMKPVDQNIVISFKSTQECACPCMCAATPGWDVWREESPQSLSEF